MTLSKKWELNTRDYIRSALYACAPAVLDAIRSATTDDTLFTKAGVIRVVSLFGGTFIWSLILHWAQNSNGSIRNSENQ